MSMMMIGTSSSGVRIALKSVTEQQRLAIWRRRGGFCGSKTMTTTATTTATPFPARVTTSVAAAGTGQRIRVRRNSIGKRLFLVANNRHYSTAAATTVPKRSFSTRATVSKSPSSIHGTFANPSATATATASSSLRNSHKKMRPRGKATLSQEHSSSSSSSTATSSPKGRLQGFIVRVRGGSSWWWNRESTSEFFRQQRTIPIPRWVTPGHQTISISEVFGHASFVLVAISYAVDDFLMLRCIAVAGSTAMLFFTYFHPHGRVLWLPFKWNALFIAINTYRIGKVLLHRNMAENLSKDLLAFRDDHFHLMDPVDFSKLVRLGQMEDFSKGDVIATQNQDNRKIRLVLSGDLEVQRDGKMTYILQEANFVSEAGLHTGLMLPGSVQSCCTVLAQSDTVRVLTWDRNELLHLMERDISVKRSLINAMSWDIVRKLKTQRWIVNTTMDDDMESWTNRRKEQTQHRYTAILQNLVQHPRLLNSKSGRIHLHNYRIIHHIDDEHHIMALKACGWTLEEFEQGYKQQDGAAEYHHQRVSHAGADDEERKTWTWYLRDIYFRLFE